jgi:hypothetical protein
MTLTDEQQQRYQCKGLFLVKSEYLLMDARTILAFVGATPAAPANGAQPATTAINDVKLPQQVREDICILARHQLGEQLCRFWVYLSWIKDLGYDGPDFWRAVAEAEKTMCGAAETKQNKYIYRTRIRTGISVVSCLLGDIRTFHALVRSPNLPVRSILDIPRKYITLEELKRLVAKLEARLPAAKMLHSSEMKELMEWKTPKPLPAPSSHRPAARSVRHMQPPHQARVVAAAVNQRRPQKRRRRCTDTPRVMKKNKTIVAEVDAGQHSDIEDYDDGISWRQPPPSKTKHAIEIAEEEDEEWVPHRSQYMWLEDEQWAQVSEICSASPDQVQHLKFSSLLLQQLHAPLLTDDVKMHKQCLMLLLYLHALLRTGFAQVVDNVHVDVIAHAMGYQLIDPCPDILLLFYQYLGFLLTFCGQREELVSWVHNAWPPHLLFNFLDMYYEDDWSITLCSLVLIHQYAEYERVRDGHDLIADDPYYDNVLKKLGKLYANDIEIRPLLDAIIQPWERWMNTSAIKSPPTLPALIFSSVRSGLANAVDAMSLQVRREQEDRFLDSIEWSKAEYFTPAVRGSMVQRLMKKCGEAQYPRDITHHAIHLLDRYCTTQSPSPIDPLQLIWEEKLWACLGLAVRMQKNWRDWTEHPFDTDQTSIDRCAIAQISQQEEVIGTALQWNLCFPATPSFWLHQLIVRTLQSVADNTTLTHQLLDARDFARAAQYVDIMMLHASHLTYRFMAAVAFCMTYRPFANHLGDGLTSITGYTTEVVSTATDTIQAAIRNIHIHHLRLDSTEQRAERHNGGDYIIDFMRQPLYEMKTDLLACGAEAIAAARIPHDGIAPQRVRTVGRRQPRREYERVKNKKPLGEGTYGKVIVVTEKGTQQSYAQKQSKHASAHEGVPSTLLREVAIMKYLTELATPHVVPLLDVVRGSKTEHVSIIMPLYNSSLADRCLQRNRKKFDPLTPVQVRAFARQLLTGIRHCHAAGIVHRDLKPENILIETSEADEQIFIADLGMSRSISRTDHLLTHDVLTVNYAAPEVLFQYSMYTSAVDMWSVGCIIVDMITGRRLFTSNNEHRLRHEICQTLGVPPLDQMVCPRMSNRAPRIPANPHQFLRDKCQSLPDGDREKMAGLLVQLLHVDLTKRISAADALKHAYFVDV